LADNPGIAQLEAGKYASFVKQSFTMEGLTIKAAYVGAGANNTLTGTSDDELFIGGLGNNTINGGTGTDRALYEGNYSDYTVSFTGTTVTVTKAGLTDTVTNVESLKFADKTVWVVASPNTIAGAVASASPNDIILVTAGNYTETLTINKVLTILGANSGKTGVDSSRVAETVIQGKVTLTAAATIDGVLFTKPSTSTSTNGINFSGWTGLNLDIGSGATVTNSIVEAFGAGGGFGGSGFVRIVDGGGTFSNSKVVAGSGYNALSDARGVGAVAVGGVNGTYTVTGNSLLVSTNGADGVNNYGGANNTVVITNNIISGTDGGIVSYSFDATTGSDSLTITGNTISSYNDNGIRVFNYSKASVVTIKSNSVTGPNPLLVDTNSLVTYVIGTSTAAALTTSAQLSAILADNPGIAQLEAGKYASFVKQSFTMDGKTVKAAYVDSADNALTGTADDEIFVGGSGDNTITGGLGDDTIDGGAGNNTAVFSGNYDDYVISLTPTITVTGKP
ncbi:MAG: hypothetical protein ACK523_13665, partial [Pirellulaceae bacterium]